MHLKMLAHDVAKELLTWFTLGPTAAPFDSAVPVTLNSGLKQKNSKGVVYSQISTPITFSRVVQNILNFIV